MDQPIPEGFELVNCPACGSARYKPSLTGRDWILHNDQTIQIVRCEQCGLNFTNPRPDKDHLGSYYPTEYAPYAKQRGEIKRSSAASTSLRTWVLSLAYGAPANKPTGWRRAVAKVVMLVQPLEAIRLRRPLPGHRKTPGLRLRKRNLPKTHESRRLELHRH